MHEGETCADYQGREAEGRAREELKRRQVQENAESEAYVGTIAKPCPKCGRQLDKYDGCDHVTCESRPFG